MKEIQKSIAVYDFDKTIYSGDSTIDFWKFCLRCHPKILLNIPRTGISFGKYLFGLCGKTEFKEAFFSFLRFVPDVEAEVSLFWEIHFAKIQPWYLAQKQDSDVVISASPEFLLRPVADKIGVSLIASRVDEKTGQFSGENCKGEEKVKRFSVEYTGMGIERFYSDSLSDTPFAVLADKAYIVSGDSITPWKKSKRGENSSSKNISAKGR